MSIYLNIIEKKLDKRDGKNILQWETRCMETPSKKVKIEKI